MTDVVITIVPAVAALAGVVLTQAWNSWLNRTSRQTELQVTLWNERRLALHRFAVAINQAKDSTRKVLFLDKTPEQKKMIDDEKESAWSNAYEAYIEVEILFPADAAELAWQHLQAVYQWRRTSIAKGIPTHAPAHSELTVALRPWVSLGLGGGVTS